MAESQPTFKRSCYVVIQICYLFCAVTLGSLILTHFNIIFGTKYDPKLIHFRQAQSCMHIKFYVQPTIESYNPPKKTAIVHVFFIKISQSIISASPSL